MKRQSSKRFICSSSVQMIYASSCEISPIQGITAARRPPIEAPLPPKWLPVGIKGAAVVRQLLGICQFAGIPNRLWSMPERIY